MPRPVALLLLLVACGACKRASAAPIAPHPCAVEGVAGSVLCATYPVWENRERKAGRRIPLNIVILPPPNPTAAAAPLFILAGGPGQAATDLIRAFDQNRELRQHRAIVFIDQRGSGGSNRLDCPMYGSPPDPKRILAGPFALDAVRNCRKQLEKVADLGLYTTAAAVDDIDEVRAGLGYDKVNLWGASYGTRAAQVYLRRHGDRVRAAVLLGVLPVDELIPLQQPAAAQRAIEFLFARYRARFPDFEREFRSVFDRAKLPPVGLIEGVRHALYGNAGEAFPAMIHRAAMGDAAPLERRAIEAESALEGLAMGLNLSVTCAEDIPFIEDAAVARATAGTFLGDARIQRQRAACREWVRGAVPADLHRPVQSSVPVLLLSGGVDPVTPPASAAHVAAFLPRSRQVVFPEASHGNFGACGRQIVTSFLDDPFSATLDTKCAASPRL